MTDYVREAVENHWGKPCPERSDEGDKYCPVCLAWAQVNAYEAQAAKITRLRAALADAQVVGFAAGVEAAKTAVSLNAWKHGGDDAYSVGMDVGARQQNEQDLAAIRALTPPDLTAAAARVLLVAVERSETFTDEFKETVRRVVRGFEGENA